MNHSLNEYHGLDIVNIKVSVKFHYNKNLRQFHDELVAKNTKGCIIKIFNNMLIIKSAQFSYIIIRTKSDFLHCNITGIKQLNQIRDSVTKLAQDFSLDISSPNNFTIDSITSRFDLQKNIDLRKEYTRLFGGEFSNLKDSK